MKDYEGEQIVDKLGTPLEKGMLVAILLKFNLFPVGTVVGLPGRGPDEPLGVETVGGATLIHPTNLISLEPAKAEGLSLDSEISSAAGFYEGPNAIDVYNRIVETDEHVYLFETNEINIVRFLKVERSGTSTTQSPLTGIFWFWDYTLNELRGIKNPRMIKIPGSRAVNIGNSLPSVWTNLLFGFSDGTTKKELV